MGPGSAGNGGIGFYHRRCDGQRIDRYRGREVDSQFADSRSIVACDPNIATTQPNSLLQCSTSPAPDTSLQAYAAARSQHPAGVNVLMCDGSGDFVTDEVDPTIWQAYSTRTAAPTNEELNSMRNKPGIRRVASSGGSRKSGGDLFFRPPGQRGGCGRQPPGGEFSALHS